MAVSFLANSWQLANWGFSAGDIAALAGAGRGVITWLSASGRDKALLDFLKTSSTDLGMRRGLINPVRLNERWSTQIILFQNGRRCIFTPAGKRVEIKNIAGFTWIMTIVIACLDVIVINSILHDIVVQLLIRVFKDSAFNVEYLQHEIPNHIQGWRSTACVRGMISKAQCMWRNLKEQGRHLPGLIPPNEAEEIVQLLHWLMTSKSTRYSTSSSDVFSLAILLADLGFNLLRTGTPDDTFGEANIVVIFDSSFAPSASDSTSPYQRRYGMRIPLQSPEECISLWPGSSAKNNHRRQIFVNSMEIGADLQLSATYEGNGLEWRYNVLSKACSHVGRSDLDAHRLVRKYVLLVTKEALEGMLELIESWSLDRKEQGRVVRCLELGTVSKDDMEYFADLQVFLLGYYYGALMPLVNVAQLSTQEAIGSWTWYDLIFLGGVGRLVELYRNSYQSDDHAAGSTHVPRIELMKLVAYLFAGAENDQMSGLGDSTQGAYGLNAKLVLLSASLLGLDRVGQLELLDIDPTCIPSDHRGIIRAGRQPKCATSFAASTSALHVLDEVKDVQDFTVHIQPAWGFDPDRCLLTFRHNGRLVHKIHPGQLEYTALVWRQSNSFEVQPDYVSAYDSTTSKTYVERTLKTALLTSTSKSLVNALFDAMPKYLRRKIGISSPERTDDRDEDAFSYTSSSKSDMIFRPSLSDFHGGNVVLPGKASMAQGKVILLPILALERAQLCIMSMYKDHMQPVDINTHMGNALPPRTDCGYFNTNWKQLFPRGSFRHATILGSDGDIAFKRKDRNDAWQLPSASPQTGQQAFGNPQTNQQQAFGNPQTSQRGFGYEQNPAPPMTAFSQPPQKQMSAGEVMGAGASVYPQQPAPSGPVMDNVGQGPGPGYQGRNDNAYKTGSSNLGPMQGYGDPNLYGRNIQSSAAWQQDMRPGG